MRRIICILLMAAMALSSASAYNPYGPATGYSRPYYPQHRTESHMPGDAMVRIVASTHDLDWGRARLAAVLYAYAYLADDPGTFRSSEEDFLASLLYDMRRAMEGWQLSPWEDRAVRELSERLSTFLEPSRRDRWQDLRWAIEDSFPRLIRALMRIDS